MSNGGDRFNEGKRPYHLMSPYALQMLTDVLAFGAKKYAPHNWAKGLKWEEGTVASMLRHLERWRLGEDVDPETGLPHVSHILCNAMFLAHFVATDTGEDDRAFKIKEDKNWSKKSDYEMSPYKTWYPTQLPHLGVPSDISPTNEPMQGS